mmetsp:Transcript_29300/g.53116  ORF Transcript_29300/g.53116 Transcript_29300/m.53116 type:complete len:215 (+) Transcript_29300:2634-3278(+)
MLLLLLLLLLLLHPRMLGQVWHGKQRRGGQYCGLIGRGRGRNRMGRGRGHCSCGRGWWCEWTLLFWRGWFLFYASRCSGLTIVVCMVILFFIGDSGQWRRRKRALHLKLIAISSTICSLASNRRWGRGNANLRRCSLIVIVIVILLPFLASWSRWLHHRNSGCCSRCSCWGHRHHHRRTTQIRNRRIGIIITILSNTTTTTTSSDTIIIGIIQK